MSKTFYAITLWGKQLNIIEAHNNSRQMIQEMGDLLPFIRIIMLLVIKNPG